MSRIQIRPTDRSYMSILRETLEQFFTKRKERRVRQTIVFQNYGAFGLFKNPIESSRDVAPKA